MKVFQGLCSIAVRIKGLHKLLVSKTTSYIHRKPVLLFPGPYFQSAPKPIDSHTQSVARRSKVAVSFLIHCMDKANIHNSFMIIHISSVLHLTIYLHLSGIIPIHLQQAGNYRLLTCLQT